MPFFDFHIHPSLKSLFSENNPATHAQKFSPWAPLDKSKIPMLLKCCTDFQYILASQGNLTQLATNDCNLVCIALYIPEKDMLTADLVQQSTAGPLDMYLQAAKINAIINGNPYKILRTDDWPTLTNAAQFGVTDKRVKPIKTRADFNENDASTIHAVFSVEGCHTLSSLLQNFDLNTILANIDDLRSQVSLVSVNMTHMEQSPLCNHAFGMQFLSNDGFKPTGYRLTDGGIAVLKHCYQNKIMIDLKHLSLGSRQHLYELRSSPDFAGINQPLVCTHAGLTGLSYADIPDYIFAQKKFDNKGHTVLWQGKPVKYGDRPRPCFNAASINLYDEDIMQILQSGGMLGFSLDKRILGFQDFEEETSGRDDFPLETEYISNLEQNIFFGTGNVTIGKAFTDNSDKVMKWDEIAAGGVVNPAVGFYHLKHFMAHVVHVMAVAGKNNYDVAAALNQLCIGSDFDGLINPVWCCETADSLAAFQSQFEDSFVSFAQSSGVALPGGFDVKSFSARLFYQNGRDFILKRLDVLNA